MTNLNKIVDLTKPLTLLYVEDNKEIRENLSVYLNKLFKKVDAVDNGKDALFLYENNAYDLVITDIQMPKMSGIELSHIIKNKKPEQSIIFSTAFSDNEYFLDSIKLGIDAYVLKPLSYKELNAALYKVAIKIKKFKEHYQYEKRLERVLTEQSSENLLQKIEFANNYEQTLFALIEIIEKRDTYTGKHSQRVANYTKLISKELGLSKKLSTNIYKASILHDLGKIAIPDSLLLKPTKLKNLEYDLIKEHVNIGFHMLDKIPMFKDIAKIIVAHHEKIDGSGYPNALKGDEIPMESNLMALCDTFDAMTTTRIYKEKKSIQEALNEIEKLSGIHFRKELVDAALICFKNLNIDKDIDQLPKSNLEKERFSYFYKDSLTEVYNEKYLDLVLSKNIYEQKYKKVNLVIIENFGKYNRKNGWIKGNDLLINLANKLAKSCNHRLTFRVHGNNFIVLGLNKECKKKLEKNIQAHISQIDEKIKIKIRSFDIIKKEINSLTKLESYL